MLIIYVYEGTDSAKQQFWITLRICTQTLLRLICSYLPALSGVPQRRPVLSFIWSKALPDVYPPAAPDAQASAWNC